MIKIKVTPKGKQFTALRRGIGPIYAEKNGGLVLKHETSWRKLSGFWINTSRGCIWIQFRRSTFF